MDIEIVTLGPGDEAALEAFLVERADSSMFLRSNARAAGLVDEGKPLQGTYVAAMEGDRVAAVAAHCWNGMVLVQAPAHAGAVARAAVERSGRAKILGLSGPRPHVLEAREALGLGARRAAMESNEKLFALDLAALRIPAALASGEVQARRPRGDEIDWLARARADYLIEVFGHRPSPELDAETRADVERLHARGDSFVLTAGGPPIACTAFNARLPDSVQVGGVWTPPPLRGRGYARAVVAGSLIEARAGGASRAILFTGEDNRPAIAAYEALGFAVVGDYGLVIVADP